MSLKAKIEAVIYASEEPVTLAQLVGLLGEEGQTEIDILGAQQQTLALKDEAAIDGEAATDVNTIQPDTEPVKDAAALNAEPLTPTEILETDPSSTEPSSPESGASDPDAPTPEATASEAATDEKKLARDAAAETKARERRLRDYFRSLLEELIADYANGDRGLEIREVAGGFRIGTKPEYHDAVRGFVKSLKPPLKLTLQALETLAVVAYKQPVTSPEISEIRGVDSAGVLGSLLARKLITTAGRKQVIGRPILYKTTKDFLLRFGLKDINELPSIEEFEKMAGELNDAVQEEIMMEAPEAQAEPQTDEPQTDEPLDNTSTPNPGGSPPLDELHAAPEPTHIHHDTAEDLMSDRSAHLDGHNREHADKTEVDPQTLNAEMTSQVECDTADGTPDDRDD